MKEIKKIKDASLLTKKEQQSIQGGNLQFPIPCRSRRDCFLAIGELDWACVSQPHSPFSYCQPL
ncbi:hypothetical protein [Aquimarina rhabdastrellae]